LYEIFVKALNELSKVKKRMQNGVNKRIGRYMRFRADVIDEITDDTDQYTV